MGAEEVTGEAARRTVVVSHLLPIILERVDHEWRARSGSR